MKRWQDEERYLKHQAVLPDTRSWEPRQLRTGLPYAQVFRPDGLRIGQSIALLRLSEPEYSATGRLVIGAFQLLAGRSKGLRGRSLAAAVRGSFSPEETRETVSTLWRGEVDGLSAERVSVTVTHGHLADLGYYSRPEDLPEFESPHARISEAYQNVGLQPVPQGEPHAGRWLPFITISFDGR